MQKARTRSSQAQSCSEDEHPYEEKDWQTSEQSTALKPLKVLSIFLLAFHPVHGRKRACLSWTRSTAHLSMLEEQQAKVLATSISRSFIDQIPNVIAPSIAVGNFDGLRGIVATKLIRAGDLVLSVPFSMCFTDSELNLPHSIESSTRLAAALLVEKLTPSPRRAAHLEMLPDSLPLLCARMSADIRKHHMTPGMRSMADDYIARESAAYEALRVACSDASSSGARQFAMLSGSLKEPHETGSNASSLYNLRWALDVTATRSYGLVTVVDTLSGSELPADASVSDLLDAGELLMTEVICPVLDLFNHDAGSKARVELRRDVDGAPEAVCLYAGKDADVGEQLFLSYGEKSNERLLASYGFVPKDRNLHNYVLLQGAVSLEEFFKCAERSAEGGVGALKKWQDVELRVYDSGPFGQVDSSFLKAARKAAAAGGGGDRAVAITLAVRARTALELCSKTGEQNEPLAAALERAMQEGDAALEAVLTCRVAACRLWSSFIRGLERFAATVPEQAGSLDRWITRSKS